MYVFKIWQHFVTAFVTNKAPYATNSILKEPLKSGNRLKKGAYLSSNIRSKIEIEYVPWLYDDVSVE